MPRLKTRKNRGLLQDKVRRNAMLLLLLFITLVGGSTVLFTAFGPSSGWEADVGISGVGVDSTMYTPDSSEIQDLASLLTARIVKIDFDGSPIDGHPSTTETFTPGLVTYVVDSFEYNDYGMKPKVDFSVGQFFMTDAEGNKITSYSVVWENVTETEGKATYYFGFSMAFTTRAEIVTYTSPEYAGGILYRPYGFSKYWLNGEDEFGDLAPISLSAIVDINVTSLTNYTYYGSVEDVSIKGAPRARYTIDAADAGVIDTGIDSFNTVYDWKEEFVTGSAAPNNPTQPVSIVYDVINSTTQNVAQLSTNAILRPGADCNTYAVGISTGLGGGVDNVYTKDLFIYNVELIYDFVVETSINGIPITAMGDWLSGRIDSAFIPPAPPEQPTFWEEWWWVILAIGVVILFGGGASRRRG